MEKLKLVIGPAPSELNYEELISKLSLERERISEVLLNMTPHKRLKKPAKAKAKKTLSAKELKQLAELIGLKF